MWSVYLSVPLPACRLPEDWYPVLALCPQCSASHTLGINRHLFLLLVNVAFSHLVPSLIPKLTPCVRAWGRGGGEYICECTVSLLHPVSLQVLCSISGSPLPNAVASPFSPIFTSLPHLTRDVPSSPRNPFLPPARATCRAQVRPLSSAEPLDLVSLSQTPRILNDSGPISMTYFSPGFVPICSLDFMPQLEFKVTCKCTRITYIRVFLVVSSTALGLLGNQWMSAGGF